MTIVLRGLGREPGGSGGPRNPLAAAPIVIQTVRSVLQEQDRIQARLGNATIRATIGNDTVQVGDGSPPIIVGRV